MDKKSLTFPLAKYKGQPLEVLAQDPEYLDWCLAQPWFKDRYPEHYTVIINNFREPNETPEHNALQIKYLERSYQEALLRVCVFRAFHYDNNEVFSGLGSFPGESQWALDATVSFRNVAASFEEPGCDLEIIFQLVATLDIRKVTDYCKEKIFAVPFGIHQNYLRVEFKPSLGDDYPAVLRQIKRAPKPTLRSHGFSALVIGGFSALGATYEQVKQMFFLDRIYIVKQDGIEDFRSRLLALKLVTA